MRGGARIAGIALALVCLCAAAALASAGALDHSFSGDGKVTTDFAGGDDDAGAIAVDAKNRVVAVGTTDTSSASKIAVARYKSNGELDATFSHDGKLVTAIDDLAQAEAVALDAKGRIVAAGEALDGGNPAFLVIRYKPNGKLDRTFGGDGEVLTPIGTISAAATSVQIDGKGRIVAGGTAVQNGNEEFAVVRYKPSGKLDHKFSGDGKVVTSLGGSTDYLASLAIDAKNRVVAGGYTSGLTDDFAVVRYKPNGALDHSFSGDGKVTTSIGDATDDANAVAIDRDGRIVAAGFSDTATASEFAVVRYKPSGGLDHSFSGDGKVTTALGSAFGGTGRSMTIDKQGRIVVSGRSFNAADTDFALVRYLPSGELDNAFSGDGKLTTSFGSGDDFAKSVKVDRKGRVVAGGRSFNGSEDDFAVARYHG